MPWRLRDGLHYAVSGGAGIFLDVPAQRYFALPATLDQALRTVLQEKGDDPDPDRLAILRQQSILVPGTPADPGSTVPPLPSRDRGGRGQARLPLALRSAIARKRAGRDLRCLPLVEIAARLPHCADREIAVSHRLDPFDVAETFERLRDIWPAHDQCLPETLALVRICRGAGFDVKAVLGVCATPFAAHCWAQRGDVLLNDRLDRVAMFTPILAW